MDNWSDRRKQMNSALRRHAVPVLRSQGFTGSFPHFRLRIEERIHVIGFQFSSYGMQFYIEMGITGLSGATFGGAYYPPETIKHYQTQCRRRIGDVPFDYTSEPPESVALRAVFAITSSQSAWHDMVEAWQKFISSAP